MIDEYAFEEARQAFRKGAPGVLHRVASNDSYPGEPDDRRDAYLPLPTTYHDEEVALRKFLTAYLNAEGLR